MISEFWDVYMTAPGSPVHKDPRTGYATRGKRARSSIGLTLVVGSGASRGRGGLHC